jgi:hypothetical protein
MSGDAERQSDENAVCDDGGGGCVSKTGVMTAASSSVMLHVSDTGSTGRQGVVVATGVEGRIFSGEGGPGRSKPSSRLEGEGEGSGNRAVNDDSATVEILFCLMGAILRIIGMGMLSFDFSK